MSMSYPTKDQLIKVLVVDDHPVVRGGLALALSNQANITVVGQAEDGIQAVAEALRLRPDAVLMDIYMPGQTGLEAMIAIRQSAPEIKVLLLTISEDESILLRSVRLGADGFIHKSAKIEEILGAIRKVVAGELVMSERLTPLLLRGLRGKEAKMALSRREEQVLIMLGEGLTNSEIGNRLSLSHNTVNSYVQRLLDKLNLDSRAAAIAYANRYVGARVPNA